VSPSPWAGGTTPPPGWKPVSKYALNETSMAWPVIVIGLLNQAALAVSSSAALFRMSWFPLTLGRVSGGLFMVSCTPVGRQQLVASAAAQSPPMGLGMVVPEVSAWALRAGSPVGWVPPRAAEAAATPSLRTMAPPCWSGIGWDRARIMRRSRAINGPLVPFPPFSITAWVVRPTWRDCEQTEWS